MNFWRTTQKTRNPIKISVPSIISPRQYQPEQQLPGIPHEFGEPQHPPPEGISKPLDEPVVL